MTHRDVWSGAEPAFSGWDDVAQQALLRWGIGLGCAGLIGAISLGASAEGLRWAILPTLGAHALPTFVSPDPRVKRRRLADWLRTVVAGALSATIGVGLFTAGRVADVLLYLACVVLLIIASLDTLDLRRVAQNGTDWVPLLWVACIGIYVQAGLFLGFDEGGLVAALLCGLAFELTRCLDPSGSPLRMPAWELAVVVFAVFVMAMLAGPVGDWLSVVSTVLAIGSAGSIMVLQRSARRGRAWR